MLSQTGGRQQQVQQYVLCIVAEPRWDLRCGVSKHQEVSAHAQSDVAGGEDPARDGARGSKSLQRIQSRGPGAARGASERRTRRDAAAEETISQAAVEAGCHHDGEAGHKAVGSATLQLLRPQCNL